MHASAQHDALSQYPPACTHASPFCILYFPACILPMQVLNMKPPEILALLEEASGTKMFEKKKQLSQKQMDKKEARLQEIDKVRAHGCVA